MDIHKMNINKMNINRTDIHKTDIQTKELDSEIKQLCKRLRIPGIYRSYDGLSVSKEYKTYSKYKTYLIELLRSEVESRENNAIIKRIKQATFPTMKRFEELEKEQMPQDAQDRLQELKSLKFIDENRNVIMLGNSGTGKTHLATAIGIQACEKGYTTSFKTAARLINEIKEAKRGKELVKYAKIFEKYDLVILDEVGYIPFDLEGAQLLFEYIAMRYERKSTIITTNLIFSQWIKIFHDKALTMALLDRLTYNAIVLNMNGESFRRKQRNKYKS